jgi:GNAT superfamily N-acetyltransferase
VARFSNLFGCLLQEEGYPCDPNAVAAIVAQVTLDVAAGLAALYGAYVEDWPDDRVARVGCVEVVTACDPLIGWHHVLTRLYVEPAFRRRGIGMRLIRAAVGALDHLEDRLVITTRGDLPRSYKKLGAKPLILTSHATVGEVRARLRLDRKVG